MGAARRDLVGGLGCPEREGKVVSLSISNKIGIYRRSMMGHVSRYCLINRISLDVLGYICQRLQSNGPGLGFQELVLV